MQDLRKNIENIKFDIERAKRDYDYATASKLEFEDLVNAKKDLQDAEEILEKIRKTNW